MVSFLYRKGSALSIQSWGFPISVDRLSIFYSLLLQDEDINLYSCCLFIRITLFLEESGYFWNNPCWQLITSPICDWIQNPSIAFMSFALKTRFQLYLFSLVFMQEISPSLVSFVQNANNTFASTVIYTFMRVCITVQVARASGNQSQLVLRRRMTSSSFVFFQSV